MRLPTVILRKKKATGSLGKKLYIPKTTGKYSDLKKPKTKPQPLFPDWEAMRAEAKEKKMAAAKYVPSTGSTLMPVTLNVPKTEAGKPKTPATTGRYKTEGEQIGGGMAAVAELGPRDMGADEEKMRADALQYLIDTGVAWPGGGVVDGKPYGGITMNDIYETLKEEYEANPKKLPVWMGDVLANWTEQPGDNKPIWKNYGQYAAETYGTAAPGFEAGGWGPQGARIPGNAITPEMVPPPEEPDYTGGYGGVEEAEQLTAEGGGLGPPKWEEKYHVPGAPDWWKGIVVTSTLTPELEYAMLMNSMIPFLSAEDQRSVATNLATLYPDVFGGYSAVFGQYMNPPTEAGESVTGRRVNTATEAIPYLGTQFGDIYTRNAYSQERANEMLKTLNVVKSKTGQKMGPGFTYLQQLQSAIRDFGGRGGSMPTRENITKLMSALDPLIGATESESLSAYGPISKMITTPFMSAGSVLPVSKLETGEYVFGQPNRALY